MRAVKLDTEIRQEQIAQAALTLVAGQGVKSMTVERIARLVGLAPSAIYRHFKGKREIMEAVIYMLRQRLLDNVEASRRETANPIEALRAILMRQVSMVMHYQALPRLIFSDEIYGGDPILKGRLFNLMREMIAIIGDVAREGQELGFIRKSIPPETIGVMFIGLFQPSAMLWHVSGQVFDMTMNVDQSWKIFLNGVAEDGQGCRK